MPSGGGTSQTVSKQELSPEQQELLGLVMPDVKRYAGTDLKLFPKSTVAPTDPLQTQGRQDVVTAARGPVDQLSRDSLATARGLTTTGARGGVAGGANLLQAGEQGGQSLGAIFDNFGQGQGARNFLQSGALLNPATNPVLGAATGAALRPIEEGLRERILPGIRSDFVGNNMFGSSRQGIAEGQAIDEYIKQAGDIATNFQTNAFDQGLGAMLASSSAGLDAATSATGQALGAGEAGTGRFMDAALRSLSMSPSLANLAFLPGMATEAVGSANRADEQARLSEEAERFTTQQALPFMKAQNIANLAFGMGGGSATTTAEQNPAFDPVGTGLGTIMMATMLPRMMMGIPF